MSVILKYIYSPVEWYIKKTNLIKYYSFLLFISIQHLSTLLKKNCYCLLRDYIAIQKIYSAKDERKKTCSSAKFYCKKKIMK